MNDSLATSIVTVLMGIIGVAIIAVLVSQKGTVNIIREGGTQFSGILGTALSPVTSSMLGN